MNDMDSVKQQILEIEDFNNVSEELMQKIVAKDEYRMLFEQYRSLSETISNSVPAPEKDGVRLSDAVMKRVKEGDIAPRYINTNSFRFPFATAACLCVVLAVVLVSKSGFLQSKMSDSAAPVEMNLADLNSEVVNDGVYNYSAITQNSEEQKIIARYDSYDGGVNDEEYIVVEEGIAEEAEIEEAKSEVIYDATASGGDTRESSSKKSESFADNMKTEQATEKKKAVDDIETEYEESEAEAESEMIFSVSSEVLKRLEAARILTGDEDVIGRKDIADFGEENYIAFFDSILEKDDFKELYTFENFVAFCNK